MDGLRSNFRRLPGDRKFDIQQSASQLARRENLREWEMWLRVGAICYGVPVVGALLLAGGRFSSGEAIFRLVPLAALVILYHWCRVSAERACDVEEIEALESELGLKFGNDGKVHIVTRPFGRSPGLDPFEEEAYDMEQFEPLPDLADTRRR
jgi:hypothetical protein